MYTYFITMTNFLSRGLLPEKCFVFNIIRYEYDFDRAESISYENIIWHGMQTLSQLTGNLFTFNYQL